MPWAWIGRIGEIIVASHYTAWFLIIAPIISVCTFFSLFTPLLPITLSYFAWCLYDKDTPYRGGRRVIAFRNSFVWRFFANHFPAKLHKTANFDPEKCYILAHHPHAVIGIANVINFGTEATGVGQNFPGITFHPLTMDMNFWLPLLREFCLSLGLGAVSASSIINKMTKLGPGQAVSIIVGGAAEAGLADPDDPYKLKLKSRRGFVKLALKTGASLVPVFTFGEMDAFTIVKAKPGSILLKLQELIYRIAGVWPVVFYGKGLIMPYRRPLNTVVGVPIEIPKIDEPSHDDVVKYHSIYIEALEKLFNENVSKYGDPSKKLQLL